MFNVDDELTITAGYDEGDDWRAEFKVASPTDTSHDEEIARRLAAAELDPVSRRISAHDAMPDTAPAAMAYSAARDTGFERLYRQEKARNEHLSRPPPPSPQPMHGQVYYDRYYDYIPSYYDLYATARLKEGIRSIIDAARSPNDIESRIKSLLEKAEQKPRRPAARSKSKGKKSKSKKKAKKAAVSKKKRR